jgi:hypothetical protein
VSQRGLVTIKHYKHDEEALTENTVDKESRMIG